MPQIHQAARDYPITPKEHGIDFLCRTVIFTRAAAGRGASGESAIRWSMQFGGSLMTRGLRWWIRRFLRRLPAKGNRRFLSVDYFGQPLHLTQTGQLYLEAAAMSFGRVYCFGPTFRAEKSKTRRHLTEFWMAGAGGGLY